MIRVALDAMGGDYAPKQIVVGAVEAACGIKDVRILLVGQLVAIEREVAAFSKDRRALFQRAIEEGKLELIPAPEEIGMDETPVEAVRKKKGCSFPPGRSSAMMYAVLMHLIPSLPPWEQFPWAPSR